MAKKRCWARESLNVIRWGKQHGKQRFKCKNCSILFTRNRPSQKLENRFIWFRKWILERQTYKTLSRDSKLSKDTLQRTFHELLNRAPRIKINKDKPVNLRIDGTYFNRFCLISYQDEMTNYTQLIRFSNGENYNEIKEDLQNLLLLGLTIESITTDGHKGMIKSNQRCSPKCKRSKMSCAYTTYVFTMVNTFSKAYFRTRIKEIGANAFKD